MQGWFSIQKLINVYHIDRIKVENNMIISIHIEKAFHEIQYPLIIKTLKLKIVKNFLNLVKGNFAHS